MVKNPNWLFTSAAEELNSGLPNEETTPGGDKNGTYGFQVRQPYNHLTTLQIHWWCKN